MGNRLSKIYTRTGDAGTTKTATGTTLAKDSVQICAGGDIDELNSAVGLCLAARPKASGLADQLALIQHRLFDLGSEVTLPGFVWLGSADVEQLETHLDSMNESLKPLKNFILPGGCESAARLHMARSVCRRAERSLCSFAAHQLSLEAEAANPESLKYLNRLSDWLFVAARFENLAQGAADVLWEQRSPLATSQG